MPVEQQVLPPRVRQIVYAVLAAAGIVIAAIQAGYAAVDAASPTWLLVTSGVYAFLAGPAGIVALANTTAPAPGVAPDDEGWQETGDGYQSRHSA